MKYLRTISLAVLAITCSCAVHTGTGPVGKGNLVYTGSLGGPVIKVFGLNIPTPWLAAGAKYGLKDDLDVSGSFHITPAAYGILVLDPAVTWYPLRKKGYVPSVSVMGQLMAMMSIKSGMGAADRIRVYPVITPASYWPDLPGKPYLGTNITIPLTTADYDAEAARIILSPFMGARIPLGRKVKLVTELKYHAPHIRSDQLAVTFNAQESSGINYGAISPMLGLEIDF